MLRTLALALGVAALSGCASTTEPLQVAPNLYRVAGTGDAMLGGLVSARAYAKRRANRTCARLGTAAVFTDESYVAARTQSSTLITFRCGPAS